MVDTQNMEMDIEKILEELTLEEKIKMIHGCGLFKTEEVKRLNIPSLKMSDGPMGVRAEFKNDEWTSAGNSEDSVSYCPSNTAIASTWNRELAGKAGSVLGEEARGRGKDVILGPGINIKRTPLCGRNFEYYSEDPYLVSELVVPCIEGIQQNDVAACVKHFAVNGQETERLWVNVELSERALREIYLPGFKAAIKKAKSKTIMGAYNLFRGTHCCESSELLGDILRKEWNYDGVIISDWGAVHDTVAVAKSPLDIEMSITYNFDEYCMANPLIDKIKDGSVDIKYVDEKVRNILRLMMRLNMIEYKDGRIEKCKDRKAGSYNTPEHRQDILEVARQAVVLLKNNDHVLPFNKKDTDKVLVIGENAIKAHANGGGSAEIKALYEITPFLGIVKLLGGNTEVTFAKGYESSVYDEGNNDVNWQADSLKSNEENVTDACNDKSEESCKARELREEAVRLAKEYDKVIFVGGLNHDYDIEGRDKKDIRLPYEQDVLIKELVKANENTVVCIMAGSAVDMSEWQNEAKTIVYYSYNGMEGGTALAQVLFGEVNPSGKLAETFPYESSRILKNDEEAYPGRKVTDEEKQRMNAILTQEYKEGIFVGYRYYEKYNIPVAFPFGHGLSYTTFEYSDMNLYEDEKNIQVELKVKNTGDFDGYETVEIYVGERNISEDNPVKELKGFEKVWLKKGEEKTVHIDIAKDMLTYYNEQNRRWELKNTEYIIYAGSSSKDIRQSKVITL